MKYQIFGSAALLLLLLLTAPAARGDEAAAEKILFEFIGKYCLECHDSALSKADRDFEPFEFPWKRYRI